MSIIYEKVDYMILNKRLSLLENINFEDFISYTDNDSLLFEEYLSNKDITKIFLDVLKNAKDEMKLAKKYKKENNIKETKLHLQKASKLLEDADKTLDINRYTDKLSVFWIGTIIYLLYNSVICFISILPGFILQISAHKQLHGVSDNIDKTNKIIKSLGHSATSEKDLDNIIKICKMMVSACNKQGYKDIHDAKVKRSVGLASQLIGLLLVLVTKCKKIENLKWSESKESPKDAYSLGTNPYLIQIRVFINDFRKIIQKNMDLLD